MGKSQNPISQNPILFCLFLIAIIITSGCLNFGTTQGPQVPKTNYLNFESSVYGMSMKYPGHWELQDIEQENVVVIFVSPLENESDTFNENLNISLEYLGSQKGDLEQFTGKSLTMISENLPDMEIVEAKRIEVSGLPANRVILSATVDGTKMNIVNVWLIDSENYAHLITFLGDAKKFDSYKGIVEEMIGSYKIGTKKIKVIPFLPPQEENPQPEQAEEENANTPVEETPVIQNPAVNPAELEDPTATLPGKWRAVSKNIYYNAGGSAPMETFSIILLYLNADKTWGFGTMSGTWSVSEITQNDWAKWGVEPFGVKYKLTLNGWNGSADGPIEQTGSNADFIWVLYNSTSDESKSPGQIHMKFSLVPE